MPKDKEARKRQRQEHQKAQRKHQKRQATRAFQEQQEVEALEATIAAGAPPPGSNPLTYEEYTPGQYASARRFDDLPISSATKTALRSAKYTSMTAVQRATIPHALAGRDVLGAAKTGSGKTLAFLVPLVELLYRRHWARLDGLGALVLTPTRELAIQIFETLVKVGASHDFSAGLLIGGKNVKEEQLRVGAMNIIIATPGRLLQHMDETPGFDASPLQLLVLDEADRILDMGFAATLDAILDNLPRQGRQTLLFSATQTKSVKDLARLSLTNPEYISVHAEAATPTPLKLQQAFMVVPLASKMDVLWGFLKTHLRCRTIVFLSTCKQVRFVHEVLRRLRPGVPLRCLHGGMKQGKRLGVYQQFAEGAAGEGVVLLATDIAARGLDFPNVDWVVQFDCPEDVTAYIHRAGRSARYTNAGRALLLLTPGEQPAMLQQLSDAKVPIKQLRHNPAAVQPIGPALQALLSKSSELKEFAQRALVAYVRSVFLQPNKAVFDAGAHPLEEYAASLGLLAVPKLRFIKRAGGSSSKKGSEAAPGAAAAHPQEQQEGLANGDSLQQGRAHSKQQQQHEQDGEEDMQQPSASGDSDSDAGGSADTRSTMSGSEDNSSQQQQQAAAAGRKRGRDAAATERQQQGVGTHGSSRKKGPAAELVNGDEDADQDDDEDDFLVVKQQDVFNTGDADDASGAPDQPLAAAAAAGVVSGSKKKKKQRIKLGAVSGARTVFDDEGQALDPLALLAADSNAFNGGERAAGDNRDDDDSAGAAAATPGLHVVADAPAARFQAAQQLMRARDKVDRAAATALRQQMRAERKARLKALVQGDAGRGAVLAHSGGGGSSGEEDGSSSDDGSEEEVSGHEGECGSGSSSGSEGGGSDGEGGVDAAYMGMVQRQRQPTGPVGGKAGKQLPAAGAEALALQLLQQRHGR